MNGKKIFKVWWPDRGQGLEDAATVWAFDAEDAACKWAAWYDYNSSDHAIVGGEVAEIWVLGDGDCVPGPINVVGEMTRSYRARERKP